MRILLTEPVLTKYLYINPANNRVHLLIQIGHGKTICGAISFLKEFFNDEEALRELINYKWALIFDIQLLKEDDPQRVAKEDRLIQILAYIDAINTMQWTEDDVLALLKEKTSGLYGVQLKLNSQKTASQTFNPVFSINCDEDAKGVSLSALSNSMQRAFPVAQVPFISSQNELIDKILIYFLPVLPTLADIQQVLMEQCQRLFGLQIDFTRFPNGDWLEQESVDGLIGIRKKLLYSSSRDPAPTDPFFGFEDDDLLPQPKDYINFLLDTCAPNVWEKTFISPFYSIASIEENTEQLSILTQAFLAHIAFYCKVNNISQRNFGVILDASSDISNQLVNRVCDTFKMCGAVEENLCIFFNGYTTEFEMSRPLKTEDIAAIKQQFIQNYKAFRDLEENISLDNFMILDTANPSPFVIRNDFIYMSFAYLGGPALESDYFESIRQDFRSIPLVISHKNELVFGEVEVEIDALLDCIEDEEQFERLPKAVKKEAYRKYPILKLPAFLNYVAQGKQVEAEELLITSLDPQVLLVNSDVFTDYSDRTFNCTAYEYSYWAKDTHMCRMLGSYMNDETKAVILERINQMEHIDSVTHQPVGLVYRQKGREHRSVHFDMTPLKDALAHFARNYVHWGTTQNWAAMKAGWMEVGLAQRDVPAHVAQEYCRPRRPFAPTPRFNENILLRVLTFYNATTERTHSWFPLLPASEESGLGFDFALTRGKASAIGCSHPETSATVDWAAILRLDKIKTLELTNLHECLRASERFLSVKL